MAIDIADVKELVIGLLNGEPEESGFLIYGMSVSDGAIDAAIEISRRNLYELVGATTYNNATNENRVSSCLIDMACHRVVLNMMGIAIGVHFYYKTSDLTISKNVQPALEAAEEFFRESVRKWIKVLMGTNWSAVGVLDDLTVDSLIYSESLGHDHITRDSNTYSSSDYL